MAKAGLGLETGPMEVCGSKTSQSASILGLGNEANSGILAFGSPVVAPPRPIGVRTWEVDWLAPHSLNPTFWEAGGSL